MNVLQGGGETLTSSVAPGSIDGVRVERVLQHIELAKVQQILEEVKLALKPGGFLIVTEPLWTDRHVDLGLPDKTENARIHDTVIDEVHKTIKNPSIGRELVKLCTDAGLSVANITVYTSTQRTVAEFDRVTKVQYYSHVPGFVDLLEQAERRGSLCVLFPFVTVVAKKK